MLAQELVRLRRRLIGASLSMLAAVAVSAEAGDIVNGRQVYQKHCAMCHGPTGVGVMPGAPNFARSERLFQPDATLVGTLRNGRNAMPPFVGVLTDRELFDVVAYLRTLR